MGSALDLCCSIIRSAVDRGLARNRQVVRSVRIRLLFKASWHQCKQRLEREKLGCVVDTLLKGCGAPIVLHLFSEDDEKRTRTIHRSEADGVLKSLNDHIIVFFDGYVKARDHDVLHQCGRWRLQNKECRRLVVVCSMVSIGKDYRPELYGDIPSTVESSLVSMTISPALKQNTTKGPIREQQQFKVFSWTLDEYQEALKSDIFYEHVKAKFTAESSVEVATRWKLLDEKFFVVGGSARLMFDSSTEFAMESLLDALDRVTYITQYLQSTISCTSDSVVNRLFSWYLDDITTRPMPCIVSRFVANEIGLRTGPVKLQSLARCLATNPSMDGWLLELLFFSSLTNGGAKFWDGNLCEEWKSTKVVRFDPDREISLSLSHQWLAPKKWNQGSYDAVYFESKDLDDTDSDAKDAGFTAKIFARIIQVTRSKSHSFEVDYYKDLLSCFATSAQNWLHKVEVCFVVPDSVIATFRPPVDEITFRMNGVQPSFYPGKRTEKEALKSTSICIRVVALEHEKWSPRVGEKRLRHN